MQVSSEDRTVNHPSQDSGGQSSSGKWIALLIALGLLGGLGYYVLNPTETTPVEQLPEPHITEKTEPVVTDTTPQPKPKPEIPQQAQPKTETAFVLPSLDNSDIDASKQLTSLTTDKKLTEWFHTEHVIRRGVTLIDGLSRGLLLNKMHKTPGPKGTFVVIKEGNKLWVDPANYQRYAYLTKMVESIDSNKLVNLFHLFRPLLEEAYSELGYPAKDFDNTVIAALDQVLTTPIYTTPIALTQESVRYKYADPTLENLPPLQKQLLRMGPENTQIIQGKAQILRKALLRQ
jgi:Protein of unknown function (DUF3014)